MRIPRFHYLLYTIENTGETLNGNVKNYIFARKQLFVSFFFFFFFSINNRRTRAIIAWITIHKPYLGGIIDERVAAWRDSPLVFSLFLVCTPTHARRCPRGYKLLRRSGPGAKSAAVPIRNYKRCRSSTLPSNRLRLLRLLFAFFPPPPPPQPPRLTALFFSPPPLLLPPISSVEPADRTCHRSSFHPRHDACLSTPWTGPTFYRDHLPPLSLLPRSFCPLLVFPFFFPSSPSRFIPLSLSSFNFPPIEMKTKLGGIPLPPVVFDNNST